MPRGILGSRKTFEQERKRYLRELKKRELAERKKIARSLETEKRKYNPSGALSLKSAGKLARFKSNPGRLTDVLVKRGGKVFKAKAKYDGKLGRVRVFVNPRVAKAAGARVSNPLKIVPMTKERYESEVKPRLRAPYNLLPFAIYRRGPGRGMHMLYKDGQFIKGGSKSVLKKYARREAGF